jgi:hypothetical protein
VAVIPPFSLKLFPAFSPMNFRAALFFFALVSAALSSRAGLLLDNGAPDLSDASEMTHWIDANQFTLSSNSILWQVRFWDAEASTSFQGTVYWEIHSDNGGGVPGPVLFSGLSTNVTHSATGRAIFGAYPEYVDNFDLPSVFLGTGNYWLVLHNGPLSNNLGRDIFWEQAINSSTAPSLTQPAPFTGPWESNGASSQLAFQLYGVPDTAKAKVTAFDYNHAAPRISFQTTAGQSYQVQYSNALVNPTWIPVAGAENVAGNGAVIQITDHDSTIPGLSHRFYRVTLLPMFTTAALAPVRALQAS